MSTAGLILAAALSRAAAGAEAPRLEPLPPAPAARAEEVALGRQLFFDPRLAGDESVSCAECHNPDKAYSDGWGLAFGYSSALYFRNTPSLLNAARKPHLYWDGRFSGGGGLEDVVRDHLSEAHFMLIDGLLAAERLRQTHEYTRAMRAVYGGDPSYGSILKALGAFVASLASRDSPLDRRLRGEGGALSPEAERGMALFTGKAGCVRCHGGALLGDGSFHDRGVPENPEIHANPFRAIVFRRFFKNMGVPGYADLRRDLGRFAVTKDEADRGRFATPSLREVARTAPYMHNGAFATLEEAAAFEARDAALTPAELAELVAFLRALDSDYPRAEDPGRPDYAARPLEP